MLREWHARLAAWRDHVPLDCLLCRSRAPGGLCVHCRQAVRGSMSDPAQRRCKRCALALPEGCVDCPDCQAWAPALGGVVAVFDYDWPGELLIHRLKRQGRYGCAPVLAGMLAERLVEQGFGAGEWVGQGLDLPSKGMECPRSPGHSGAGALVTAVPASRHALAMRGYNPAAEVGRALARRLALEWRPGLLRRTREAHDQKRLGRRERRTGVDGLYQCHGGVAGRAVLVVDDVMTTGSTLDAIARELRAQGAAPVHGAVLARTPMRGQGAT